MGQFATYTVNAALESGMLVILSFLLITCLLQRKRFLTANPLILLISANLLLLLCQVAEWMLMIASGNQTADVVPAFREWKILTYTLDYAFTYYSSVAFYHYVSEHIREMYLQNNQPPPGSDKKWLKFLLLWGLGLTILFEGCLHADWFYYLKADGSENFHHAVYGCIYLMGTVVSVSVVVKLIRHRKILGNINLVLLLFYKLSPIVLVISDLRSGTCLTYLMQAFYTFILYVHVDMRREKEHADREVQLAKQEKELLELHTQIMLSQMQPHFLYNSLTTISGLCYLENAQQAKEVVDKFAAYFRQNLDSMGKDKYIPFETELQHIQTYLWIEKVRFEDDLTVEYKIGPSDFQLPSLSLQPLVENAVKHGICKKKGGGTVTIETKETPEEYLVIVRDNGVGFDPQKLSEDGRSHIGIENITQRLEILCSGRLEIWSKPGEGTIAVVRLPKEEKAV